MSEYDNGLLFDGIIDTKHVSQVDLVGVSESQSLKYLYPQTEMHQNIDAIIYKRTEQGHLGARPLPSLCRCFYTLACSRCAQSMAKCF